MGTDRTGVLVGESLNPIMQYEVEATEPPRQGLFGADYEIVKVLIGPDDGMKGIIEHERRRRGIGWLDQSVFQRIRTSI